MQIYYFKPKTFISSKTSVNVLDSLSTKQFHFLQYYTVDIRVILNEYTQVSEETCVTAEMFASRTQKQVFLTIIFYNLKFIFYENLFFKKKEAFG